jgi:hypothetical protein
MGVRKKPMVERGPNDRIDTSEPATRISGTERATAPEGEVVPEAEEVIARWPVREEVVYLGRERQWRQ